MLKICDMRQLIESAKNMDEVICYGAGQELECFAQLFAGTEVLDKCNYVADRSADKQGMAIEFGNKQLEVISPEKMRSRCRKSCIVVITCARYKEILDYFESDGEIQKSDYYCLQHFKLIEEGKRALNKKIPSNLRIYKEAVIPKIIHYCWFGNKAIPDHYKRWMESWTRFCPDYEIKEWNEKNYDISKNKYMQQAYENKKWAFVPDYARLDIIYRYGGIYLDTDIELLADLDELLYQDGFMCFELETRVNCGMGFGAVKGLEIIREMRDDYDNRIFLKENGELDLTPSPLIQTEYLEKRGLIKNGEYQKVGPLTIYPEKFMGGKNWVTRKIDLLPYTKAIHHFDGSWLEADEKNEIRRQEQGILLAEKEKQK